jgi:hypothetical protein
MSNNDYAEMLERTDFAHIADYLMSGCEMNFGAKRHISLALHERDMDDAMEEAVRKCVGSDNQEALLDQVHFYGSEIYTIGFTAGVKAGVKMLLSLMDSGEIFI